MSPLESPFPSDDSDSLEEIIEEFENAWGSGAIPEIEDFLPADPSLRSQVLIELVHSDLEFRVKGGEQVEIERYLQPYPELAKEPDVLRDLIKSEFELKRRDNPLIDPGQYWKRFPEQLDLLQEIFPEFNTHETVVSKEEQATALYQDSGSGPQPEDPSQATSFGDYILLKEISRGGMGIVYKAQHRQLKRVVALKLILSGALADEEQIKRFYAEAEAAAKLDHPGIVPLYNFGKVEGKYFIEMAFVEGESLAERVRTAPAESKAAAQLLLQVSRGIQHAHEKGIIHRDLKPANILIDQAGQPRVTDFGLAKHIENDSSLTATGQVMGTPSYMSPEQAQGVVDQIDERSDVYSLGATLYELLTGKPPFQNASVIETLVQVVEDEPVSPSQLVVKLPADLETICLKCLEKAPSDRYQSAAELAEELKRFLNGEPIIARPTTRVTRFWRWCKRKPGAALAGLSVIIAAIIVCVGLFLSYQAQSRQLLIEAERNLDQSLKNPSLTTDYRDKIELQLHEIARLNSARAELARQNFRNSFSNTIAGKIHQPNLSESDKSQIENAVKFVRTYDVAEADSLRKELQERLGRWQPVFQQSAPFEQINSLFAEGQAKLEDQKLYPAQPAKNQVSSTLGGEKMLKIDQKIYLNIPSTSMSQFKVVFDKDWQKAAQIGLVLNGNPDSQTGYSFLLKTRNEYSRVNVAPNTYEIRDISKGSKSFLNANSSMEPVTMCIRKNDITLVSKEIAIDELLDDSISLSVTRNEDQLLFQINHLKPVEYRDAFPIKGASQGVFALDWPRSSGIISLQAFKKKRSSKPGSILYADKNYVDGEYEKALLEYRKQLDMNLENQNQNELLYKQGLCLIALNQLKAAEPILFQVLKSSEEDRWSSLAGCQLWLLLLRQNKYSEAELVYDVISNRFDFDRLVSSVPQELRQEIINKYSQLTAKLSSVFKYDAKRVQKVKLLAAIDRLLSHDGIGTQQVQLQLAQAYELAGELDQALAVVDAMWNSRHKDDNLVRIRARYLRLLNRSEEALQLINGVLKRTGTRPATKYRFLLERAYVNCAIGNWPGAEKDIESSWGITNSFPTLQYARIEVSLLRGFLHYRKGDFKSARTIWATGFNSNKHLITQDINYGLVAKTMILGSLSNEMTVHDSGILIELMLAHIGDHPLSGILNSVAKEKLSRVAINAFNTPRGIKYAQGLAFQQNERMDNFQDSLALIFVEFAKQLAFHRGELSAGQESEIWNLGNDLFDGFFRSGEIDISHLLPLAATLKGQVGFLGWAGVTSRLNSSRRARLAYLFAHYYLERKQSEQARRFFNEAKTHAEPGSTLSSLVEDDLLLLDSQSGRILVQSNLNQDITLIIRQDENEVQRINAKNDMTLDLPSGRYEFALAVEDPGVRLQKKEIIIVPTVRQHLEISGRWGGNQLQETIPGLVPFPAKLSGYSRWQVIPKLTPGIIDFVACSPDGQKIACGARNGMIRVYRAGTYDLLNVLAGHTMLLKGIAWSPDSSRLASISMDHTLRIWDSENGSEQLVWKSSQGSLCSLAWSPDGSQVYVGTKSFTEFSLTRFQISNELSIGVLGTSESISVSPDGKWIVSASIADGSLRLWNTVSDTPGPSLKHVEEICKKISWSPDGTWIATGYKNGDIRLWNTATFKCEHILKEHRFEIRDIIWSPDSNQLYSCAGFRDPVMKWEVSETIEVTKYKGSLDCLNNSLSWWHQKDCLISTSGSWGYHLWGKTRNPPPRSKQHRQTISSLDWNPDGTSIAASCILDGNSIVLVDPRNGFVQRKHQHALSEIHQVSWDQRGKSYSTLSYSHVDIRSQSSQAQLPAKGLTKNFYSLAWGPDDMLAVSARDSKIHFWNADFKRVNTLEVSNSPATSLAWSQNGILACITNHSEIYLWDHNRELIGNYHKDFYRLKKAKWNSAGDQLLISTYDKSAFFIWDSQGLRRSAIFGGDDLILDLDWSYDDKNIVLAGHNPLIQIVRPSGEVSRHLKGHFGSVNAVSCNPQGDEVASGGCDGTIRIWDLKTGDPQSTTMVLPDGKSAVFSPGGKVLHADADFDHDFVYLVEEPAGNRKLITPDQFRKLLAQ